MSQISSDCIEVIVADSRVKYLQLLMYVLNPLISFQNNCTVRKLVVINSTINLIRFTRFKFLLKKLEKLIMAHRGCFRWLNIYLFKNKQKNLTRVRQSHNEHMTIFDSFCFGSEAYRILSFSFNAHKIHVYFVYKANACLLENSKISIPVNPP